jgi:oligopeptide/dipeptide ABC transporter ATP-binding protein
MQQRAIIAAAIALDPALIIADEPTTALDATIQSQILELLSGLIEGHSTSLILVTHNLAVVAEMAVMYAGRIIEMGHKADILDHPLHPYTVGLLESVPSMTKTTSRIKQIPGVMPSLDDLPPGCSFNPRCTSCRTPDCFERPPLREISPGRWVACHFPLT